MIALRTWVGRSAPVGWSALVFVGLLSGLGFRETEPPTLKINKKAEDPATSKAKDAPPPTTDDEARKEIEIARAEIVADRAQVVADRHQVEQDRHQVELDRDQVKTDSVANDTERSRLAGLLSNIPTLNDHSSRVAALSFPDKTMEFEPDAKADGNADLGLARKLLVGRLMKLKVFQEIVGASGDSLTSDQLRTLSKRTTTKLQEMRKTIQDSHTKLDEIASSITSKQSTLARLAIRMDSNVRDIAHQKISQSLKDIYSSESSDAKEGETTASPTELINEQGSLKDAIKTTELNLLRDYRDFVLTKQTLANREVEFYAVQTLESMLKSTVNDSPPDPTD